jgi:GNAT superfamily N-acetyltransferase
VIRPAALEDVPAIVEMGQAFVHELYEAHIAQNPEQMRALVARLILGGPDSVVFVHVGGSGSVDGMIGAIAYDHHVSGERIAGEVFWFVDPASRGSIGIRLLKAAERWAREQGASSMEMIQPIAAPMVGDIYKRLGYGPVEVSWRRKLGGN